MTFTEMIKELDNSKMAIRAKYYDVPDDVVSTDHIYMVTDMVYGYQSWFLFMDKFHEDTSGLVLTKDDILADDWIVRDKPYYKDIVYINDDNLERKLEYLEEKERIINLLYPPVTYAKDIPDIGKDEWYVKSCEGHAIVQREREAHKGIWGW